MATLSLDNAEIVRAVLVQTGLGRDAAQMDAATEADVRAIIRSGLRWFFYPQKDGFIYQWRFLEDAFELPIEEIFSDGTIAVSGGTVTLTDGTWPDDIVDHYIDVDGHILFVTERTGDTTVTVSHTQVTVAAGTEYEAPRFRFDLPSDFGEFLGPVVYQNESDNWMLVNSEEQLLKLRYANGYQLNNKTEYYAVSGSKILFWPTPIPDAFVHGTYLKLADDNLAADLTSPGSTTQVNAIYAEAMMAAILAAAEAYNDDTAGIHAARFQAALASAMAHDQQVGGQYDFSRQIPENFRGHGPVSNIEFNL